MKCVMLPFSLTFLACIVSAVGAPRIACKQPVHDFGTLDNTKAIEHTFLIWNEGDTPLEIGQVRACCGGTAEIARKTITPGTNTTLKTRLSLRGRNGRTTKSFYVASNDPAHPYYQLQLVGSAVASVCVNPESVNFGPISFDVVVEKSVYITCQSAFAFHITNVLCEEGWFAAACESSGSNSHCVTIRTVPPLAPGVNRGKTRILTDNKEYPRLDIPVLATVSGDILVVPKEILLSESGDLPSPVNRYIAIRSRSKTPFKILEIETPEPGIESNISSMGIGGYRCELRNIMPSRELDGKQVLIVTDCRGSETIPVPIRVTTKNSSAQAVEEGLSN